VKKKEKMLKNRKSDKILKIRKAEWEEEDEMFGSQFSHSSHLKFF